VLSGSDLPFWPYVASKACHGVLAALLTFALAVLFPEGASLITVGQFFSSSRGIFVSFLFILGKSFVV
jgi:hypothetical protein